MKNSSRSTSTARLGNKVQAGFYTPEKQGELWDTRVYYHQGTYYQFGLKSERFEFSLVAKEQRAALMLMVSNRVNLAQAVVVEGTVRLDDKANADGPGLFLDDGHETGKCVPFAADAASFGNRKSDSGGFAILSTVKQDLNFGREARFRVVMKHDMMECYINDYLAMTQRVAWNGQLGFMCRGNREVFKDVRIRQSNWQIVGLARSESPTDSQPRRNGGLGYDIS